MKISMLFDVYQLGDVLMRGNFMLKNCTVSCELDSFPKLPVHLISKARSPIAKFHDWRVQSILRTLRLLHSLLIYQYEGEQRMLVCELEIEGRNRHFSISIALILMII